MISLIKKYFSKDTLKGEHLNNSNNYIQTGIYNSLKLFNNDIPDNAEFIDFYEKDNRNIDFIISKLNENNKYSDDYKNCTGIIAIAKAKETGKNISFITHQNPDSFSIGIHSNNFKKYITKKLNKLKKESEKGTIDIIILGGNSSDINEYESGIEKLNKIIYEEMGFSPTVVGGFNKSGGKKIFIDTAKRSVYYYKGNNYPVEFNINYIASNVTEILNELRKKNIIRNPKRYYNDI